MTDSVPLLAQRATISRDLASSLRELGSMRAAITRGYGDAWQQSSHLAVTERTKTAQQHTASFTAEAQELEAECDALRVELAHIDQVLQYG